MMVIITEMLSEVAPHSVIEQMTARKMIYRKV
jgi:hypothetical protein